MIQETQEYLNELQRKCLEVIRRQNLQLHEFLYTTIFNEKYFNLANQQDHLNFEIERILLYPFKNQPETTTMQAVTLIPGLMYFVKGMDLEIDQIIKIDPENKWEILLTAFAHRINNQLERYEEQLRQFKLTLERESLQWIGMDLEKTKAYIETQIAPQTILKQLYNLFLQDAQQIIQGQEPRNYNILTKQKLQLITNIYKSFKITDQERTIEYNRMKIAMAYLTKDYGQKFVNRSFDHIEAGLLIFSFIQLDKRQFQSFLSQLSINQQEQLLNRVIVTVEQDEAAYYKVLLVGRCLYKLRLWKHSLRVFDLLIKKIKNYPRKEKFSIYIQYKICKIMLVTGQVKGLGKKFKNIFEMIVSNHQNGLDQFYQNKKSIYHQCLFFQLLLSAYKNNKDPLKSVLIMISKLNIYNPVKGFSFLQIQFIKLIQITGIAFQDQKGEKQLDLILKALQEFGYESTRTNLFVAAEELLILNVLLQHKDIYVLQYLNPNYSPVLKRVINNFQASTQAYIYFFLHEFDSALNLATQLRDFRLMAQIYEQQGNYQSAVDLYKKVFSPNSQFSCAVINKINNQHKNAFQGFTQLELQSHFMFITKVYKDFLRRVLNYQDLEEGLNDNYQRQQDFQTYRASRQSSIFSEKQNYYNQSFYTESKYCGSFNQDQGLSKSINLSTAKQSMAQNQQSVDDINMQLIQFPLRGDVQFFYQNLLEDLTYDNRSLLHTLNEFLDKTKIYQVESNILFGNNKLQEVIASGGQGVVYRFEYLGKEYAAKVIEISYDETKEKVTKSDLKQIENKIKEINILCGVSQSNIKYVLQLRHIGFKFKLLGQQKTYKIYLFTDLHQPSRMIQDKDLDFKTKFLFKLSLTLFTLQNQLQILHLDLKPANVLMNSKNGSPVLIDFGLSKLFTHSISKYLGEQQMTLAYADPEIEQRSRKNDVYSFGVSAFQYITNEIPYNNCSNFSMIMEVNKFTECHQQQIQGIPNIFFRNLIQDCTKPLKDRITFLEVIHRFCQYLYSDQVQLIDLLFNYFRESENNKISSQIWLLKQFLERVKRFRLQPQKDNIDSDVYIFEYKFERNISQIIQKITQISNWIKLSSTNGVQKLLDFKLIVNQSTIQFKFFAEKVQKIDENLKESKFVELAKILQEIHSKNVCLWKLPKQYCYQKNGQIKIQYYQLSEHVYSSAQSEIENDYISNQVDFQNDVNALAQLIQDSMFSQVQNHQSQENINLKNYISQCLEGANLSLDQLIEVLQK